jgi:hypothetical protein
MVAALRERMLAPERGVGTDGLGSELLLPYERREMTRRIAAVMDEIAGVRRGQPLAV